MCWVVDMEIPFCCKLKPTHPQHFLVYVCTACCGCYYTAVDHA